MLRFGNRKPDSSRNGNNNNSPVLLRFLRNISWPFQFSCVGLLLFLVEVGALVYVKVYDQSFMTFVDDKFMDVSRMDLPSAKLMDFIQSTWECCGKNGPADWGLNIPSSCCTKPVTIGCNNTVSSLLLPAYNGHFYKQAIENFC